MGNWLVNHWFSAVVLAAWMGLNIFLFVSTFLTYWKHDEYFYTREILGLSLPWARACAACLNFNCLLILLPVCRNLLSFLRGTCLYCGRTMRKQLDNNLTFHKLVGYTIAFFAAIHTIAHMFNIERFNNGRLEDKDELTGKLSDIGHDDGFWINPIHSKLDDSVSPTYVAFTTVVGITGVVITLALILIITSSTEFIRRCYFEVFWYTHHLFIVFFAGLVIHGIGRVVRGQTALSMEEHRYNECKEDFEHWGDENPKCREPRFEGRPPATWYWVLAPIILYVIERVIRFIRSQQRVLVTKAVIHPSKVLEMQMQKKGFSMEVGQYVFINCPSISQLEWHPFTLTSAPEEDFFSVHIRSAGDWTEKIIDAFQQQKPNTPKIAVDGPFGTASEDVFHYEVSMLVGAGIGVTPFASILKSIWYKFQHEDQSLKTKKIYFYWICRETGAFAWFADLLASLEQEMMSSGKANFLNYKLFLTSWDSNIAGHAIINFDNETDAVTGLKQKTCYGRPVWNNEFSKVAEENPRSVVGVFLCGPQALAKTLQKCCQQYSSIDPRKVQFYFNKENF